MRTDRQSAVSIGDIVAAVYDSAEQYSLESWKVSVMAAATVRYMLHNARERSRGMKKGGAGEAFPDRVRARISG